MRQFNSIEMLQAAVVRDDYALAWRQAGQDLQLLGVAPAEFDAAARGGLAVARQHEQPVSPGLFQKCAGGNHHGTDILAQPQPP